MLDHALSLATASGSGAILGLVGNMIHAGIEKHRMTLDAASKANKEEREDVKDYVKDFKISEAFKYKTSLLWGLYCFEGVKPPRAIEPPFASSVLLITISYCASTLICFLLGDIVVATQNPTAEPTVTEWVWGFYRNEHSNDAIAVVTFASVGAYMAHFLAFILSAVITGVVPKRSR